MSSAGFAHHGGRLGAARIAYSQAPQPWIDLSTGINPRSYPAPRARGVTLNRLPDTGELARLEAVAAAAFGVADPALVVATGGTEPALRLLPFVVGDGTGGGSAGVVGVDGEFGGDAAMAEIFGGGVSVACAGGTPNVGGWALGMRGLAGAIVAGPTYGSHVDGWAKAGVAARIVADAELIGAIGDRTAVIVVNPNNPDGRLMSRDRLRQLHDAAAARGGVLVVDEAFAEVTSQKLHQSQRPGRGGGAHEDDIATLLLRDEPHAAQDERPHENLHDLRVRLHNGAQFRFRNRQDLACPHDPHAGETPEPAQSAHLPREVAGSHPRDRRLALYSRTGGLQCS